MAFGLLGPINTKLVFRSQIPKESYVTTFDEFIGFILEFWLKRGLVYKNRNQGSRHMAFLVF